MKQRWRRSPAPSEWEENTTCSPHVLLINSLSSLKPKSSSPSSGLLLSLALFAHSMLLIYTQPPVCVCVCVSFLSACPSFSPLGCATESFLCVSLDLSGASADGAERRSSLCWRSEEDEPPLWWIDGLQPNGLQTKRYFFSFWAFIQTHITMFCAVECRRATAHGGTSIHLLWLSSSWTSYPGQRLVTRCRLNLTFDLCSPEL